MTFNYTIEYALDGKSHSDSGTIEAASLTAAKLAVLRLPPFGATVTDYSVW